MAVKKSIALPEKKPKIVAFNNSLASLDLSGKSKLWYLACNDNKLATIDISGTDLLEIDYSNNSLDELTKARIDAFIEQNQLEHDLGGYPR